MDVRKNSRVVPPEIVVSDYPFTYIESLTPERTPSGAILEMSPQSLYAKAAIQPLNRYGHGSFCTFRVVAQSGMAGVYALVLAGSVQYIGECQDLARRFGYTGYGSIYPRNCYVGGQSTNCKINQRVLNAAKADESIDLYFYPTSQRKQVEQTLIRNLTPPWNGRL